MKIRLLNWLIIIDILAVLLIFSITFIPSSAARIFLGLPFLLFFPGYTLLAVLFARQDGVDGMERVALSFGLSIAVTALLGLGLNYTPWGIRLEPVLYSISAFVFILSAVALFRQARYFVATINVPDQENEIGMLRAFKALAMTSRTLKLPGWEGNRFNKALTVMLVIAILGAIGALIYTVVFPKVGEKFTEFYILGNNGKAEDYPSDFVLNSSRLAVGSVQYGPGSTSVQEKLGTVTLGIVNHEQETASYNVVSQIDGVAAPIINNAIGTETANTTNATNTTNNTDTGGLIPRPLLTRNKPIFSADGSLTISLAQGEKWEGAIGFAPTHVGDNQKVEFFLYKDGAATAEDTLHLWVNVTGG